MTPHAPGAVLALVLAAGYLAAAWPLWRSGRWPGHRAALWLGGAAAVGVALAGPVAARAHHDFAAHMTGHVLLGMLAPLLLVHGAPFTLLLRRLPTGGARRSVRLLGSRPLRLLTHPVSASVLNVGGLWLLYRTPLYATSAGSPPLHVLVHAHVLIAGYVFTAAFAGVDPSPHRSRAWVRAVVLLLALSAHSVLAKTLYGHPPPGVPPAQARQGALVMYYGGDAVDLMLIAVFLRRWLQLPRRGRVTGTATPGGTSSRLYDRTSHAGARLVTFGVRSKV